MLTIPGCVPSAYSNCKVVPVIFPAFPSTAAIGAPITNGAPALENKSAQGSPGAYFECNTPLTAELRPNLQKECVIRVVNDTTASYGYAILDTSGVIRLYANVDLTTPFTSGVTNTVSYFSFTYTLNSP